MEKKYFNLKPMNFSTKFCLGSISNGFSAIEPRKGSLNRNMYNFSVTHNSFDKSDILNINKCLRIT